MKLKIASLLAAAAILTPSLRADDGMWLFSAPPRQILKDKYGFELTNAWLEHVQKASVRFNSGGSASLVSGDGLVITNHHVGFDSLQKLSTKEKNYVRDGFLAKTLADEPKCVDLEVNQLISIEDVTARVNAALPEKASADEAVAARRKVIAEIEKESLAKTGLRSDVVTLYQGGAYHLYRYKRYTDIRLVFAPEQQIAFFGGDPDNFEFPRYDLDICLFRIYENGKPIQPEHFLKFSKTGAADGELTFVSGNPGGTSRQLTMEELTFIRDYIAPFVDSQLKRREVLLTAWGGRSAENARRAKEDLFGIQNSRKVYDGRLAALYDASFVAAKAKSENDLRTRLSANPEKFAEAIAAFDKISAAQKALAAVFLKTRYLESPLTGRDVPGAGFNAESYLIARQLLRAGDEKAKPNGERLREYGDAGLPSFEQALLSEKPIHEDLEILLLADSLQALAQQFGATDPFVVKVLAGKSPHQRAADLITSTKVRDVAFRKKLYEGGKPAVDAANDPMIELARLVDTDARAARKVTEAQNELKKQAQASLAKAKFILDGTNTFPDATFTLRLSFGVVKGIVENGVKIPAFTDFAGLYARSAEQENREPFNLPPRWVKAKPRLNLKTPFNFTSTQDIIGGNSGSPIVNRAGEFVGIIFDGNIYSLSGDYAYEDVMNRAISVASPAILESLNKVYDAGFLANELINGKRK
jgi:Peptidase S46